MLVRMLLVVIGRVPLFVPYSHHSSLIIAFTLSITALTFGVWNQLYTDRLKVVPFSSTVQLLT